MPAVTRYLFDRKFGADEDAAAAPTTMDTGPAIEVDPEPAAPDPAIYTQEDLDRVRAEALSFGRKQGAAEAAGIAEQRMAETLDKIAKDVARTLDALREADAKHTKDAAALAVAVVRKLFPETSRRHGHTEIAGVIDAVLGRIIDKPKLTVRVSERLRPEIGGRLAAIAETHGFAGQIHTVGDDTIAEGDCRVTWAGGGAARESTAIWQEIEGAISRVLGPLDPDPESLSDNGSAVPSDVPAAAAPSAPASVHAEGHRLV